MDIVSKYYGYTMDLVCGAIANIIIWISHFFPVSQAGKIISTSQF
jgi:hypothetical protein